eukprot:CAMPEP_0177625892 /NCGR_PEP_ID=MMETSP0419_2-20121207/30353_1 /TAXON_ID=582737 /ORGANISM="Tetraselmis sp., Strain GSL018" /LENGTH=151 /DNA_ID=CAMNT_0019126891 /DNA_START=468 /DNA_END=919 /DNA_ORIENTATION=+
MNTSCFNQHIAEIVEPPSLLEPRVTVRIAGTEKVVKVRPECCAPLPPSRTEDDLKGGSSARVIGHMLSSAFPEVFIPDVLETVFQSLRLENVRMEEVSVAGVSSEAEPHPLSAYTYKAECTLEPGADSCWISREGHERPEWIVYRLGPGTR